MYRKYAKNSPFSKRFDVFQEHKSNDDIYRLVTQPNWQTDWKLISDLLKISNLLLQSSRNMNSSE